MTSLVSAQVQSDVARTVLVTFDVDMNQNADFFDPSNWTISGGHSVSSVAAPSVRTALLTLVAEMKSGLALSVNASTSLMNTGGAPFDGVAANFTGSGVAPTVSSVVASDESTIVVMFSEDLTSSTVTASLLSFATPFGAVPPSILTIALSPGNTLTISLSNEMTDGAPYSLSIASGAEDLAGNPLAPVSIPFDGVGDLPGVSTATMVDASKVILTFTKDMTPDGALLSRSNYSIDAVSSGSGAVFIESVIRLDGRRVQLNVTPATNGATYAISVATDGPVDLFSNPIASDETTATFVAIATTPTIERIEASGQHRIDVIFSKKMRKTAEIEDPTKYAISPSLSVLSASLAPDERTVHLVTSEWMSGIEYTVTVDVS